MSIELNPATVADLRRLRKAMRWLPSDIRREGKAAAKRTAAEVLLPSIRAAAAASPSRYMRAAKVKPAAGDYPTIRISGRLVPQAEFGAYRQNYYKYMGRLGGRRFRIVRRTKMQFLQYREGGHAVWPAFEEAAPAAASAWLTDMTAILGRRVDDG